MTTAGSVFMLLQACLGLSIDGRRGTVLIDRPRLPDGMNELRVENLQVGAERIALVFQRLGSRVVVAAEQAPGSRAVKVNLTL
jgi:hypothetical protein